MDVGLVGLALANGILTRETSDNRRIALLQVPEVVQVAVGQDDKAGVLRLRVSPGLLLADQGVLVLGLRLQHDKRKCMAVQQQEVDETVDGFLEVVSVRIEEGPGHLDMVLQDDVGRTVVIIDQSPACLLQKLVDLDPCGCFFLHALPVTSLQLLHAYSAWLLEVYHERTKRPPQARGVLAHGFPPARQNATPITPTCSWEAPLRSTPRLTLKGSGGRSSCAGANWMRLPRGDNPWSSRNVGATPPIVQKYSGNSLERSHGRVRQALDQHALLRPCYRL